MRLVWTTAAVIDLEQISDYIFEKNPELAATTIHRIFQSTSELKLFPRRGRLGRKEGTRELVLTQLPYLVVYEVVDQSIRVLRVLHGARRWPE
jgi:toxin ParE1/3/4